MISKKQARQLKKNKVNTKWLMLEIMNISSIDFTTEHMNYKLHQYGFGCCRDTFKWMNQLCDEGKLIFNGYMPVKVEGSIVGYNPVFGLIENS